MKLPEKIFQTTITLVLLITFSLIFGKEYLENYEEKSTQTKQVNILKQNINSFKLEEIKEIEDIQFYYTPNKPLLEKIIQKINNSKKKIYLEVYMLTETRIKQALVKAKNRGIEVKVLLEKNPYKANNINNKHYNFLNENNILVKWSNPENYSLNHSKFIIIDDEVIISTGNFTYSTFAYNRDMFLVTKDQEILTTLIQVFKKDFAGEKAILYNNQLVISPNDSRYKFSKIFDSSKINIKMYFQYLKDEKLEEILIKKAKQGIKIEVIVSENFYLQEKNKIKTLEKSGIQIKPLKKPKMHSKAILVDDKYLFIGSINFSNYSLDKNREIGILLTNRNIIEQFKKLFKKDFAK